MRRTFRSVPSPPSSSRSLLPPAMSSSTGASLDLSPGSPSSADPACTSHRQAPRRPALARRRSPAQASPPRRRLAHRPAQQPVGALARQRRRALFGPARHLRPASLEQQDRRLQCVSPRPSRLASSRSGKLTQTLLQASSTPSSSPSSSSSTSRASRSGSGSPRTTGSRTRCASYSTMGASPLSSAVLSSLLLLVADPRAPQLRPRRLCDAHVADQGAPRRVQAAPHARPARPRPAHPRLHLDCVRPVPQTCAGRLLRVRASVERRRDDRCVPLSASRLASLVADSSFLQTRRCRSRSVRQLERLGASGTGI